jgi:virginiamycin B lyase
MLHRSMGATVFALVMAGCAAGSVAPPTSVAQSAQAPPGVIPSQGASHQSFDVISRMQNLKQRYLSEPDISQGTDIAVGKGGTLWVGDECVGIARVTSSGAATLFPYSDPKSGCNEPRSLTPGVGGDVWFVDGYLNSIGRISPKGKITLYPLPSVSSCNIYPSFPNGIVEGPDGAMWFTTEFSGDQLCSNYYSSAIGRITAAGQMTFYYTGAQNSDSYSPKGYITVGADGAMYFPTAYLYSRLVVGRITTGGDISFSGQVMCPGSVYCTPNTSGIVQGPDGNIWITEYYDGVVIRYSGGSQGFTVFRVPGESCCGNSQPLGPRRITDGPDGAMWFTAYTALELGRVATDGAITFYNLSAKNVTSFDGITLRSKSLWFVIDNYSGQLGIATP